MFILFECDQLGLMGALLFVKNIIKIICVSVPILLLLFLTIDFVRATIEGDSDKMKKVTNTAVKRIAYAIVVFFIPTIVNGAMSLLGETTKFSSCYDLAETSYVENLAEANRLEQEIKNTENEAKREELRKKEEALKKKMQQNRKKAIDANGGPGVVDSVRRKSNGYISHATSAGSGRRSDPNSGDQNGKEVTIVKNDNSFDWTYIARFKDPRKASIAANCMEAGAKNNHIGYSVDNYESLYDEAKKVNWDLSKITKDCDTVCSTFVAVCINATGVPITKHLNGFSSDVRDKLKNTGAFQIISYDANNLNRGDVLVWESVHVGVAL